MRRRVTAGSLPQVPSWVHTFDRSGAWGVAEPVPERVLVEGAGQVSVNGGTVTLAGFVSVWRRWQARGCWREAAEQWCAEQGVPVFVVGAGSGWREALTADRASAGAAS